MNKRQVAERLASELVLLFDASGVEYTCRAVILRVIEAPAERLVLGSGVKARRVVNLACEAIHKRKHQND